MSVQQLAAELTSLQQKLVKALQDEYFCDDVSPPPEAFGWSETALRDFMESGGEVRPAVDAAAPSPPLPPAPPPAASLATPPAASGRPIILCLGDSLTEFGSHIINQPTADVGSRAHKVRPCRTRNGATLATLRLMPCRRA
jgi:isoamyl acetate esterase